MVYGKRGIRLRSVSSLSFSPVGITVTHLAWPPAWANQVTLTSPQVQCAGVEAGQDSGPTTAVSNSGAYERP